MLKKRTQLRYVKSKDPDRIIEYVSMLLPYKIEIKGSPVFAQNKWFLWYNLPDELCKEVFSGDLDKIM